MSGFITSADARHNVPANTRHSAKAGSMLGQRRRRWTNIQPALAQCHVCAGVAETEFEAEGFGHGLRQIKNVGILF